MDINYRFNNNHKRETVLLMHGFISDMSSMDTVCKDLASDFNILQVDLPGFGGTRSTGIDYTMDDLADGLATLTESLGLEKVHVLGYSMGGRTAISFLINHPKKVLSAVLESTSPGIENMRDRAVRYEIDRKRAAHITDDYEAFIEDWGQMGLFDSQTQIDGNLLQKQKENRLSQDPLEVADSLIKYGTGVQRAYWQDLKHVDQPVLLLAGEKDEKFKEINKFMAQLLPYPQLKIVNGTGHNIHMEAREKFAIIVLEFLRGG